MALAFNDLFVMPFFQEELKKQLSFLSYYGLYSQKYGQRTKPYISNLLLNYYKGEQHHKHEQYNTVVTVDKKVDSLNGVTVSLSYGAFSLKIKQYSDVHVYKNDTHITFTIPSHVWINNTDIFALNDIDKETSKDKIFRIKEIIFDKFAHVLLKLHNLLAKKELVLKNKSMGRWAYFPELYQNRYNCWYNRQLAYENRYLTYKKMVSRPLIFMLRDIISANTQK